MHPLKDKVSAGNFSLVEQIETRKINTGKSFTYLFTKKSKLYNPILKINIIKNKFFIRKVIKKVRKIKK